MQTQNLVITGLAGSGRSTILKILEDFGYHCLANFPPALIPAFLALNTVADRLAIELNLDTTANLAELPIALYALKDAQRQPLLVFVEAATPTLLSRYALTRRPHPLIVQSTSLEAAIEADRQHLAPVRQQAQLVLDTSEWQMKDLRTHVELVVGGQAPPVSVTVMSFGYKYGVPREANLVFDIRFLPNPYYEDHLRPLTGMQVEVASYVFNYAAALKTYAQIEQTVAFFLEQYREERRGQVTIAIGCTGGQHRSVAFVERLAQALVPTDDSRKLCIYHREQAHRSAPHDHV